MIYYSNAMRRTGIDGRQLKATARTLLAALGEAQSSLSVSLIGDRAMQRLNRQHRGKDRATDVLSFPLAERREATPERMLGDVVIGVETARRQAAEYDAPLQNEVYRLLIHGILHVLGYDHERAREHARMRAAERRLAAAIGMPWPYSDDE